MDPSVIDARDLIAYPRITPHVRSSKRSAVTPKSASSATARLSASGTIGLPPGAAPEFDEVRRLGMDTSASSSPSTAPMPSGHLFSRCMCGARGMSTHPVSEWTCLGSLAGDLDGPQGYLAGGVPQKMNRKQWHADGPGVSSGSAYAGGRAAHLRPPVGRRRGQAIFNAARSASGRDRATCDCTAAISRFSTLGSSDSEPLRGYASPSAYSN